MTEIPVPASRCRLVAVAWARESAALADRVRVAADALDALGASGAAHLVEARFDLLGKPPSTGALEAVVRAAGSRLLATCRPDGTGAPRGKARLRLLQRAVELGARGCDVEHGSAPPELPFGALLVVSHHAAHELSPADAARLAADMARVRPSVVKLVAPATSAAGALAWATAAAAALPADVDLAAVATGSAGTFLRLLAPRRGLSQGRPLSVLSYVRAAEPLPGGDLGQPVLGDALASWDVPSVGERTRVFAVLGWPLSRTWSPRLHSMLFKRRGLDARLVALPVRDAAECSVLDDLHVEGAAVTMPHKALAVRIAATSSERVRRLGSANSLRRRDGAWEAEDFDGPAAARALSQAVTLPGARVVILGAGGAARAAALAMTEAGAEVRILARRPEQAREAALAAGAAGAGPVDEQAIRSADALVQATPGGSSESDSTGLPDGVLPKAAVLDMVTTPPETPLLRAARAAGLKVVDGLAMLALQAAAQQRWWSGGLPDPPARTDAEVESLLRDLAAQQERP